MTLADLKAIFLQAVQDMAYIEHQQINTIYIIDRHPDIRQDSLGATYQDFLNGDFWARDWVYSGASRDNLRASWPILIVEQADPEAECIDSIDMIYPFDVMIIDKIGCNNCPNPEERSPFFVKEKTLTMLRSWLNEVYSFEYWEVDRSPDPNTFEWLSTGRQDYMMAPPISLNLLGSHEALASMVDPDPLVFNEIGLGDDVRGYSVRLKFNICRGIPDDYNYNKPVVETLATKVCKSC